MDLAIDRLNDGEWIHVFPEGGVNMERKIKRLKWGVGRIIAEAKVSPTILPFYVHGMEKVLPNEPPYIPQIGKNVSVHIGKPFKLTELKDRLIKNNASEVEKRKAITDAIQEKFHNLQIRYGDER